MIASPKNKDENVTRFMTELRARDFTPAGMRKLVAEIGRDTVEKEVAAMARGAFYNQTARFVMALSSNFEELRLWEGRWEAIQENVQGAGSKCAIILYEMWHPGKCPGIAVDIHVLTLGKSLGIFRFDCSDQKLVQSNLESIVEQSKWPDVNLLFGSLFQFLHSSRGDEARQKIIHAADRIGPTAFTMLQLFDRTKRLLGVEKLKSQVASIGASLKASLEEAVNV